MSDEIPADVNVDEVKEEENTSPIEEPVEAPTVEPTEDESPV